MGVLQDRILTGKTQIVATLQRDVIFFTFFVPFLCQRSLGLVQYVQLPEIGGWPGVLP
jgi:hypothetical protein